MSSSLKTIEAGESRLGVAPFYLTWKAREYGLHTRFIELADQITRP
jgi:UDP-N-acetyl-D-mannosaminuronate dehydrogenase